MTIVTSPKPYTPTQTINNGGTIKYATNPLKGLVKNDKDGQVKRAALAGSAITTLMFLAGTAAFIKKGKFSIKDMFNIDFGNPIRVMALATSAVIGGLTGGLITDKKENKKPKLKEAIHQFIGNIITPITIVGIATAQVEKRNFSKLKGGILNGLGAVIGVFSGVTGGNWIASKVNHKIFKEKDDRKLSVKDFGIHVDDILTVLALTAKGDKLKSFISKALPAIFLICGYEAGTKKLEPKPTPTAVTQTAQK